MYEDEHEDAAPQLASQAPPSDAWSAPRTRKSFLRGAAVAGAGAAGLSGLAPAMALAGGAKHGLTSGDLKILKAAQIAEALAVTTYTNIINTAPFFKNLRTTTRAT